ncbi:hypothetical protein BOTCAL_0041g00140 [Botryotinia calthae]|uniref:Uncharacterized protein n=1 Tax=Botryotinia calthae TaxID=38488 RepID=A0A4Y8DBY0_9HELO|nr:hypothetical protein BOTCAL_0041g00140 [Botryotinia calthae]
MHHNTKQGLIFLAFLIACGGGIAAFILLHKSHNQHRPPGKREMAGINSYNIHARCISSKAATTKHVSVERSGFFQVHPSHIHGGTLSQHRNRHRSFTPETELGNPDGQSITIPTPTAISTNVPPLSIVVISSASSIDIYSSFKVETLSTLSAAAGFQNSASSSSNPIPDINLISTTASSPQPLITTDSRHSHLRKFRG